MNNNKLILEKDNALSEYFDNYIKYLKATMQYPKMSKEKLKVGVDIEIQTLELGFKRDKKIEEWEEKQIEVVRKSLEKVEVDQRKEKREALKQKIEKGKEDLTLKIDDQIKNWKTAEVAKQGEMKDLDTDTPKDGSFAKKWTLEKIKFDQDNANFIYDYKINQETKIRKKYGQDEETIKVIMQKAKKKHKLELDELKDRFEIAKQKLENEKDMTMPKIDDTELQKQLDDLAKYDNEIRKNVEELKQFTDDTTEDEYNKVKDSFSENLNNYQEIKKKISIKKLGDALGGEEMGGEEKAKTYIEYLDIQIKQLKTIFKEYKDNLDIKGAEDIKTESYLSNKIYEVKYLSFDDFVNENYKNN